LPAGGVVIDGHLESLERIAHTFAEHVRRCRTSDPAVLRALAELESFAVSFRVVSLDDADAVWLDTAETAAARGVSIRTMQRWAAAGKVDARWENGRWEIRQNSSTERDGSRPRAASSAP
jgi:hypothetical protein